MPFRLPQYVLTDTALSQMNLNQEAIARLSGQIASGKKVQTPVDDAVAFSQAQDLHGVLQATDQYKTNIGRAQDQLSITESSITNMEDLLQRAKELSIQQANATYDASQRATVAGEVQNIIDEMVTLANSQVDGRYIFAGFKTNAAPFDASGNYTGDSGVRKVEVGEGSTVTLNIPGDGFLKGTGGGVDVFGILAQLRTDLQTNNVAGISSAIDSLDPALDQVTRARMSVGFQLQHLDNQQQNLADVDFQTRQLLSEREDLDMAAAVSEMVQRQNTLDLSRSALSKILNSESVLTLLR